MKKLFFILFLCAYSILTHAQINEGLRYKTTDLKTPLGAVVDIAALPNLPEAHILNIKAAPAPLSELKQKKQILDAQRVTFVAGKNSAANKKAAADAPTVTRSFSGNVTQGTPNDNDFAISNAGVIVSVVNTNFNIYNDTGKYVNGKLLSTLGSALGPLNRTYDPRVIYDPEQDRFIIVFLQGSSSLDTRIIIAFSQSNDPALKWNLYQVPGNITGDSSWSDYPIISITKDELFITINRLKDNTYWKDGFMESYIWQVDKMKGYSGDSLPQKVYNNIQYNGKPIWSICPAKGGSKLYSPGMFFISHRPSDLDNDSLFLHYITNTIKSGSATLTMKVLKNPQSYGLQPNALQPNGKKLQTNDARVLSAMYENGMIYYVGNTIDHKLFSPAVYFGRIENTWTNSPIAKGQIISSDTLDYGYPSIAYVGTGFNGDHSSMITFSHVSSKQFPGTSVVYVDRNFNVSGPVFVKKGEGNIDLLGDTVDRWGDYTGIQRKYNELGVCWLNGSWGTISKQNRTWIGRVKTNDPLSSFNEPAQTEVFSNLYPNPASQNIQFDFEMYEKLLLNIELMDIQGKSKTLIAKDFAKPGLNRLIIDISELPAGMYFVNLIYNGKILHTHKFLVQH